MIAKAGRPVARLSGVGAPEVPTRLGFLAGEAAIPDDFNEWAAPETAALFEGHE